MRLNTIKPAEGSRRPRLRVGRGASAGQGKTCGRGVKGQRARKGGYHKVGFEGGQMPLQRRMPKVGFRSALKAQRGEVRLHARLFEGVRRGVLIAESLWPNAAFADGCGINTLTGADSIAPFGGAAFHDNKVWLRRA